MLQSSHFGELITAILKSNQNCWERANKKEAFAILELIVRDIKGAFTL